MATHDYVIANASGSSVRSDLNNALAAIVSNNSSSSEPSTKYAYMLWADTTNGILKIRNSANNAWVELLQLDGTLTMEDGAEATPGLAFRDDLNTGIWSSAADTFNISTGGTERLELGTATVFNESGANVDFRIEGDTDANLFYVDAGNDRIGIGESSPGSLLHVKESDTGIAPHSSAQICLEREGTNYLQFLTAETGTSGLLFGDGSDIDVAKIVYDHNVPSMQFIVETSEVLSIGSSGQKTVKNGNLNITSTYIDFSGSLGSAPSTAAAIYRPADNNLAFSTGNTERLRIINGGGITFNGDTAAANALDDYEEGTFTPTWGGAAVSSITYSTQFGKYTKIGNRVFGGLRLTATSFTGSGGIAQINGFPFTAFNNTSSYHHFTFGHLTGFSYTGAPYGYLVSDQSYARLTTNTNGTNATVAYPSSTTIDIIASFMYEAA